MVDLVELVDLLGPVDLADVVDLVILAALVDPPKQNDLAGGGQAWDQGATRPGSLQKW